MARSNDNDQSGCPTIGLLGTLGKSWSSLIVLELSSGAKSFNGLVQSIKGISAKELSAKLTMLEGEDVVEKKEKAYALTTRGRELAILLRQFKAFNQRWHPELPSSCASSSCSACTIRLAE